MTGERAHYELAAGNRAEAERLLQTFGQFSGPTGLLPEQIWDTNDITERELYCGHPSGSAMPLVWAHAEYVKLLRSIRDGCVFDMPPQGVKRYLEEHCVSPHHVWRFNHKCRSLPAGKLLRIESLVPTRVRWTADAGGTWTESPTQDTLLGIHFVDLPTQDLRPGGSIEFTFYWPEAKHWEGANAVMQVV